MKRRIFYTLVLVLAVIDSFLLSKPNILGKVGLFIYKFHYLRTFPRALLTVCIVVGVAVLLTETIRNLSLQGLVSVKKGKIVMIIFVLVCAVMLVKTGLDFSKWSAGHTGRRFMTGAYLLPVLLIAVFASPLISLSDGPGKGIANEEMSRR